jgi:hypothetical protein
MKVKVNRAPVLMLWAAVVAERLGFERAEALTLGRAIAGMSAAAKGKSLGIFEPDERDDVARHREAMRRGEEGEVRLLGRAVPAVKTEEGIRAVEDGKAASPEAVERYFRAKFGDALSEVRGAMERLAASFEPGDLARRGFHLYEKFRPEVPAGVKGWGAAGELDLTKFEGLARTE